MKLNLFKIISIVFSGLFSLLAFATSDNSNSRSPFTYPSIYYSKPSPHSTLPISRRRPHASSVVSSSSVLPTSPSHYDNTSNSSSNLIRLNWQQLQEIDNYIQRITSPSELLETETFFINYSEVSKILNIKFKLLTMAQVIASAEYRKNYSSKYIADKIAAKSNLQAITERIEEMLQKYQEKTKKVMDQYSLTGTASNTQSALGSGSNTQSTSYSALSNVGVLEKIAAQEEIDNSKYEELNSLHMQEALIKYQPEINREKTILDLAIKSITSNTPEEISENYSQLISGPRKRHSSLEKEEILCPNNIEQCISIQWKN